MRLSDVVFRSGHLSDQALIEALSGGERPAHLDRCDLCAERAVSLGRWLDDVQQDSVDVADAVFTPERLAAQQSQIVRRLEQLDNPARVIAFPAASRADRGPGGRRVAASWVGLAAAAGLVIGVIGGQMSARLTQATPVTPVLAVNEAPPIDGQFLEQSYDEISIPALDVVDQMTPRLTQATRQSR